MPNGSTGASHWTLDLPGLPGRALLQSAGTEITYRLRFDRPLRLSGRVALIPQDWRDGTGSLKAQVNAVHTNGRTTPIWTATLASAATGGHLRGTQLTCQIPTDTIAIRLGVNQHNANSPHSVGRACWIEPVLTDPSQPPGPQPASPSETPAATDGPLISVLTPVHNPPPKMLEECIASVTGQTYPNWELCLVDDGSTDPQIIEALHRHAASDTRIHLHRNDHAGGISNATLLA